jgi:ABC-type phosphate transport system substrate-binding protein
MAMNKLTMAAIAMTAALAQAPARAEIVVITNPANQATRMFSEQAAQFFMGKSNQFTPIDQGKESAIRREFYQKIANKTLAQVEAVWAKIEFSAKGTMPKSYNSDAAVKKAVAADPSAIGYIEKSSVDDSVKVLLTLPP